jgi:hypothetical protein
MPAGRIEKVRENPVTMSNVDRTKPSPMSCGLARIRDRSCFSASVSPSAVTRL